MLESCMLSARRETLSIYHEVRALAWAGVMLIAAGAALLVKKHFDDIGPLTIAIAIGIAALACYAWVWRRGASAINEYIVLLGALLLSVDIAFIESQWKILGNEWQRHSLLLALLHAAAAYFFHSRMVMSLSLAAFVTWVAAEHPPQSAIGIATRALLCAWLFVAMRVANRRENLHPVFEHFAAHTAFAGAIALVINDDTMWAGALIGIALAVASVMYGFRARRELFVIYGYLYGVVIANIVIARQFGVDVLIVFFQLLSIVLAIVAVVVTHLRWRRT